jgi:O-antigen/teichoic acid export membrane protein
MTELNRALAFSFTGKYITMLVQFVSVMVISRLLVPTDIGIYSIAAGAIAIGQVLRDFGLSLYLVHEKDLTVDKIRTCFTISLLICWTIATVYWLSSAPLALFFERQEIASVIQVLSLSFLIIPFGTFNLSLIKRDMRFDRIMWIDLASAFTSVTVTIGLALMEYGVMAMAYGSIAGTLTTVVATFFFSKLRYYRICFNKVKEIARFTSFVSFSNIFTQLNELIPEAAIGKQQSMADTAFFSKANATINLFSMLVTSVVAPVIQPFMAKLNRDEKDLAKHVYSLIDYILVLLWPFSVILILMPEQILVTLYGDQWTASAPVLQIFATILFIDGFIIMAEQLLNSIGAVKFVFKSTALIVVLRIVATLAFVQFGIIAVAWSFLGVSLIRLAVVWPAFKRYFGLDTTQLLALYTKNLGITLPLLAVGWLILQTQVSGFAPLIQLVVIGLAMLVLWIILLYSLKHPLATKLPVLKSFMS